MSIRRALYPRMSDPDIQDKSIDLEQEPFIPNSVSTQILVNSFSLDYGGMNDSVRSLNKSKKRGFLAGLKRWKDEAEGDDDRPHRRLVDRDSTYNQSFGRWNIERIIRSEGARRLFSNDRFHTILHMSTWKVLFFLLVGYVCIVITFSCVYLVISLFNGCNMGIIDFREAYYFSLETMTTVGYGTNDIFFGRCWSVMFVITLQALMGLLIDALVIGLIFARLGRPQTRASTIVFSDKAVIRRIRGEYYFMFQVGELRKHQLLETRVRCYAVRHHRTLPLDATGALDESQPPETIHFQTHNMRLQHPDDELGANLLLVLPQIVVHRIDAWSPLMPPPRWVGHQGIVQWGVHEDCDWEKAPWEIDNSPEGSPSSGVNANQSSSGNNVDELSAPKMFRRQTSYWDTVQQEAGGNKNEKGPGYVYRFPDLLKRWDDVDGSRGTWYEKMKYRLTVMEQMRQEREMKAKALTRANKNAGIQVASTARPKMKHLSSIMKIVGDDLMDKIREEDGDNSSPLSSSSLKSGTSLASSRASSEKTSKNLPIDAKLWFAREERNAIDTFIQDTELEIIVILEGNDLSTGSSVQCRHSYAFDDMEWDHAICPCVTKDEGGKCVVDFSKFHDIRPVPPDCIDPGFIQSYA